MKWFKCRKLTRGTRSWYGSLYKLHGNGFGKIYFISCINGYYKSRSWSGRKVIPRNFILNRQK